jgi:hypothetical protein
MRVVEPDEIERKYFKDLTHKHYSDQFQEIIREEETVK